MNILYLSADRGIPVRGHKGAAVHVRAMADAFCQAGHAVTILTPRPGPADGPAPLAEILEVPMPALPQASGGEAGRDLQSQAYAAVLAGAAQALLQGGTASNNQSLGKVAGPAAFDFIYERYSLWSDAGARLAGVTGLPLVLEVNAPLIAEASRYRSLDDVELAAGIERRQFASAAVVVVVSEALRDYVIARGADARRVHVLANGVDPQHFHPAVRGGSVRGACGLDGRIVLGFVGRPRPWHDLETLLSAAAQVRAGEPRIHLLLVGEMPGDLPARLAHHGLADAATLTGPVPHDDVPRHIAAMDVAVSTHLPVDPADFYFSPLKLFEYLACGVPVVAAAIGQPAQIVRTGETGYLYPPGDAAALAKLHRTRLDLPLTPYLLAHELRSLERFAAELIARLPAQASRIDALHGRLRAWAETLPPPPGVVPVHRDFYYSQVLVDSSRLTLIDFDLLACGDPAIDVANFTAHLVFLGLDKLGDRYALDAEARAFVDAYGRTPSGDTTFERRCAFYRAATFFRLLNVATARPGLAQHYDTLFQVTEQCL